MSFLDRRRALIAAKKPRLPVEYQEVAFIENTGQSYVDLNFVLPQAFRIEVKSQRIGQIPGSRIGNVASVYTSGRYGLQLGYFMENSSLLSYMGNSSEIVVPDDTIPFVWGCESNGTTGRVYLTQNGNTVYGPSKTITRQQYLSASLHLFWSSTNGDPNFFVGREMYVYVYDANDSFIAQCAPCYRKSDGVVGMYDITRELFNAGTGHFEKGDNVP